MISCLACLMKETLLNMGSTLEGNNSSLLRKANLSLRVEQMECECVGEGGGTDNGRVAGL